MSRWWVEQADEQTAADEQTLESMPVGLLQLDHDWNIRYVNAAGEAMVQATRADLIGRNYWTAFPANVDNDFGRAYRRAATTATTTVTEAFYPEPLHQWFEVRAVPTRHGLWLYFTEVTARRMAQERLALIAAVTDASTGRIDAPTIAGGVPAMIVPALASWAILTLLDATGTLRVAGTHHSDPDQVATVADYAARDLHGLPATSPLQRGLHTGTPVTLTAAALTGTRLLQVSSDGAADLLAALAPGTLVVLPLRGRDRVLGALTLGYDRSRTLNPLDIITATEIAARTALALDNARLYDQQLRLAGELQRHMLTPPPAPDHAQIAVRYLPAAEAARVGGDWYDVFLQPGGATNVVVGDVVGHDTAAAAMMGQLRSMLRGIAATGNTAPADLLTQLDQVLPQLQIHTYATIAIARFEQHPDDIPTGTTRMRWASAGHPSPVVIAPDGTLAPASPWRGELMIGVDPDVHRTDSVTTLQRGSTVLFFTDGLIERRDRDLDTGINALRQALAELAHLPLEDLCDQLIDRLIDTPDDDIALVAIRLHPQDEPRPAEAGHEDVPATVPNDPATRTG